MIGVTPQLHVTSIVFFYSCMWFHHHFGKRLSVEFSITLLLQCHNSPTCYENDDIQSCNGYTLHLASYPGSFSWKEKWAWVQGYSSPPREMSVVWLSLHSASLSKALLKCLSTSASTCWAGGCPCSLISSQWSSLMSRKSIPSCLLKSVKGLLQIPVMNIAPRPTQGPMLKSSFTRPPILFEASSIVT